MSNSTKIQLIDAVWREKQYRTQLERAREALRKKHNRKLESLLSSVLQPRIQHVDIAVWVDDASPPDCIRESFKTLTTVIELADWLSAQPEIEKMWELILTRPPSSLYVYLTDGADPSLLSVLYSMYWHCNKVPLGIWISEKELSHQNQFCDRSKMLPFFRNAKPSCR